MLPRRARVTTRPEYAAAVRRGRRCGSSSLVVHLLRAADGPDVAGTPARAGFVVSRSVGPAVVRNRVRRRLRHLAAARLPSLPPGSLLVVRALPASSALSSTGLGADLDRALRRLGVVAS